MRKTMQSKLIIALISTGAICLAATQEVHAFRGFGGFHGGGFGGYSSFHSGGFGGGYGSVHYSGFSHYGPATGFTHYGGATAWGAGGVAHYGGWGGYHDGNTWGGYHAGATYHPYNYGSVTHYDANAYHVNGVYGGWGHAVTTPAFGGAVYHGPFTSGAAIVGPHGNAAGVFRGPYGGTYAGYYGRHGAGAIATLPSGYSVVTWHGNNYYNHGYAFYHPYWFGGTVSYVPIYPPVGYFFGSLPSTATTTIINNNTYYTADGVYYQPSSQNGQQGYAVVAAPSQGGSGPQELPSLTGTGPDPFQALQQMSSTLRGKRHVIMSMDEDFDEVTPASQKVQFSSEQKVWLDRSTNKLEIHCTGSGVSRRIVYDGNTLTIVDLLRNVYASVPMSGDIDSVLNQMADQYGMAQPADDLLYSDIWANVGSKLATGQYLGEDSVQGEACHHFAYTQPGIDWEIWIKKDGEKIPRKFVITYPNAPGRPQYVIRVSHFESPVVMWGADFNASPPSGATSATMASLAGGAPSQ